MVCSEVFYGVYDVRGFCPGRVCSRAESFGLALKERLTSNCLRLISYL